MDRKDLLICVLATIYVMVVVYLILFNIMTYPIAFIVLVIYLLLIIMVWRMR